METPIFSKKGQKFGSESIPFLKNFLLPSLKILGAPLGRIGVTGLISSYWTDDGKIFYTLPENPNKKIQLVSLCADDIFSD